MRKQHCGRVAACAVALVLGIAGCGDNSGSPTSYFPEGIPGQATLFAIFVPPAPGDSSQAFLIANVFVPTPTDRVRIYLNPGGDGFREATDGLIAPVASTGIGYNTYFTLIADYDPAVGGQLIARGSRNGYETSYAPISNVATIPAAHPLTLLRRAPITFGLPADSTDVFTVNPILSWQPLSGASKYLVQVNNPTGQILYSVLTTGTSVQVGIGPGTPFEVQPLRDGGFYVWSVAALDEGYRVFGSTPGTQAFTVNLPDLP